MTWHSRGQIVILAPKKLLSGIFSSLLLSSTSKLLLPNTKRTEHKKAKQKQNKDVIHMRDQWTEGIKGGRGVRKVYKISLLTHSNRVTGAAPSIL